MLAYIKYSFALCVVGVCPMYVNSVHITAVF